MMGVDQRVPDLTNCDGILRRNRWLEEPKGSEELTSGSDSGIVWFGGSG